MLSVIIPAFDEQAHIGTLLEHLNRQTGVSPEIIVADGGSTDSTCDIASSAGANVVVSERGRGNQMNAGASQSSGEYLLFLHADSQLTNNSQLADAIDYLESQTGDVAGHFPLRFESSDAKVLESLRFFEAKTQLNLPGTFNGDQGLLITRALFDKAGGFWTDLPYLEDQDFGQRLEGIADFVTLPHTLVSSARRFEEEGIENRITLNILIMGMFHLSLFRFFDNAESVYRLQPRTNLLNLRPFFRLVAASVFSDGFTSGIHRCYAIGQYAAENIWQLLLKGDIREETEPDERKYRDHWLNGAAANPVGHVVGTVSVLFWFFGTWLKIILTE